jgi:hypothetical protein
MSDDREVLWLRDLDSNASTDSLGLTDVLLQLLDSAQVIVRGPKPATVLHSRKVRIDRAACRNAWDPVTRQTRRGAALRRDQS